eukprot:m.353639 g.353639  ORF g.353639 m.353639 type:complete len:691 (+) comp27995_c0_seq2:2678-4750(+)
MAASPEAGERYIAHSPYEAVDTDELALEIGDVVIVLEFDDDGWWLCKNTRTLQQGFTPKNFLDAETVGHADATTKTTTTSSARAAVAVSLPDGPSGSSGTNDDAEEVPLTIKQKIAALREKTSREHISPPVELDGLDELEVYARAVEFRMQDAKPPTGTDEVLESRGGAHRPSGGPAVAAVAAVAPSAASNTHAHASQDRTAGARQSVAETEVVAASTLAPSTSASGADAAQMSACPTAAQLNDPVVQISFSKLKAGKLSQDEFDHILRIQMAGQDDDDGGEVGRSADGTTAIDTGECGGGSNGLVSDKSTMQMSSLHSAMDRGSTYSSAEPEYMLASGAVTDLETAKAQIGQLSRELDDVRAALESERDARDADNAASAASARKLETALETANTTRVADTSGATRRLEAGVARAEETLAMEKAARRADANALAEHEAHATEQAALIVELQSRIRALSTDATSHAKTVAAESSATITRLESDLAKANAALQREGKSREADAFALAELGASVKQKMAVVAEHEATIARLRSTLAAATAGHKAELAALVSTQPSATATASRPRAAPVVDDSLTAELPRTAPLLQNPQRAPPPQRRSPSCRPTYQDAVSFRDSGAKPDLYSAQPLDNASRIAPRSPKSTTRTQSTTQKPTTTAAAHLVVLPSPLKAVDRSPNPGQAKRKKGAGKRRLPALPKT